MHIKDKIAVVTGGCSGLGYATAQMLKNEGANVHIFDINRSKGEEIAEKLHVTFHEVDVTNEQQVESAFKNIYTQTHAMHIIVNCAGVAPAEKIIGSKGRMDLRRFKRTIEINLYGTIHTIHAGLAAMTANDAPEEENGVIINTASVAAFDGQIGQVAYSASKGAVASMTLPLSRDLSPKRIRVNALAPGLFETPMMASMPEKALENLLQLPQFPKRLGLPEEYAHAVKFLIENRYMNGETIRLDAATRLPPK